MKIYLALAAIFFAFHSNGQNNSIMVMDFVRIKNDKEAEALFFYENNWKVYRDIAVKRKFIRSYRIVKTISDSARFDLVLMTEYADSSQYKLGEERFNQIIKEVRPSGPKLLNELKPAEFRMNLFAERTETIFTSTVSGKKKKHWMKQP